MQVLTVIELEALIKEYKSEGIPTDDLEKKMEQLKLSPPADIIPLGPKVREELLNNGYKKITYSTGPIDPDIDAKIRKRLLKRSIKVEV
jgi:hypothetical protein